MTENKTNPPRHVEVLAYILDENTGPDPIPVVASLDDCGKWWTGTPGNYLNLTDTKWDVVSWVSLPSEEEVGERDPLARPEAEER